MKRECAKTLCHKEREGGKEGETRGCRDGMYLEDTRTFEFFHAINGMIEWIVETGWGEGVSTQGGGKEDTRHVPSSFFMRSMENSSLHRSNSLTRKCLPRLSSCVMKSPLYRKRVRGKRLRVCYEVCYGGVLYDYPPIVS